MRHNKIVVFDEPTANIDIMTEKKIKKLMDNAFKDSTVITIAHRINTIINNDKILVLEDGQIKEFDSPSALIRDKDSELNDLIQEIKSKKD